MRKKISIRRIVWRLRCRKCGRKTTYYSDDKILPLGWNGWYLNKTEICPICWSQLPEKKRNEMRKDLSELDL